MKKEHILVVLISLLALLVTSCEIKDDDSTSPGETDSTYTVALIGGVAESGTGNAISGATIKIIDGLTVKGAVTDDNGNFATSIDVLDDIDLVIIAFKDGYIADTTTIFAIKNTTTEVPLFTLDKDKNSSGATGTSGTAASINLYSQSSTFIGVKESGAIESAEIVFEVRDSAGVLVDLEHAVDLSFSFGATPSGGEYLYPISARTNTLGRAAVTLNTGTIAGVVQVVAQSLIDGKTIRSKPILISIHGGFPTEDLFYVACEKLNYPYLGIIGESIGFTAYLGDKYNNPVRPGTAVYFTANYGIIGGSNLTDVIGTATVELLTEPWPNDPVYGPGFFMVTSSTADENYNTISTNTVRLLSGPPILSVSPTSFNLDNGGSQTFTYTIMDVNGNPMSEGQTIGVIIDSENIDVVGATEIKFPDTQSRSMTTFSFTAYDTQPDTVVVENVKIEISTTGPNSDASIFLFGTGR